MSTKPANAPVRAYDPASPLAKFCRSELAREHGRRTLFASKLAPTTRCRNQRSRSR